MSNTVRDGSGAPVITRELGSKMLPAPYHTSKLMCVLVHTRLPLATLLNAPRMGAFAVASVNTSLDVTRFSKPLSMSKSRMPANVSTPFTSRKWLTVR